MKCADCQYWATWHYEGLNLAPYRDCLHPHLGALPLGEEGVSSRNIITMPDFGCVKFEPKNDRDFKCAS